MLEYHFISLYFDENVVVKTDIVKYGPIDIIVEIGSSLGLWLGLSAVDLLEWFFEILDVFKKLCNMFF
jgi:hypothetical protein